MERVSIGGSKVVQGAGRAVKLLGKLLGGGGKGDGGGERERASSAEAPNAAVAARASSYAGMSLAGSAALPVAGAQAGLAAPAGWPVCLPSLRHWRPPAWRLIALPPPGLRACADDDTSSERAEGGSSLGSIVALLAPPDGSVWVAHKGGTVDRYTAAGRRLGSEECGASVTAAACVGQRVWVGFSDGMIRCGRRPAAAAAAAELVQ